MKSEEKEQGQESRPPNVKELREGFVGQCFGCDDRNGRFQLGPSNRRHDDGERTCSIARAWPPDQWCTFVSHLPDWKDPPNISVLPPLRRDGSTSDVDLFGRWADKDEVGKDKEFPEVPQDIAVEYDADAVGKLLPYEKDHLRDQGWRCGSPVCWRSERLQNWMWHPNVFVLDLSTYGWSHTLKDLRTWAIINVALDKGYRHLAGWTAGNAGFSLAMLVTACNHFLRADKRLRAYALYDQGDESVRDIVIDTLKSWECVLIAVPDITKKIFEPDEIKRKVHAKAVGLSGVASDEQFDKEYLEVTEGWDVGILMYRLLFAQVIRDVQPTHVVAPLGTGNLVLGIVLAAADCERAGIGKVCIIGAQPEGRNISNQIKMLQDHSYLPRLPSRLPIMPKIANTYSPLKPCVHHALKYEKITPMFATLRDQELAGDELASAATGRRIHCEPSAMAAFAVLPQLRSSLKGDETEDRERRILVVNSGYGLLSAKERDFLKGRGG